MGELREVLEAIKDHTSKENRDRYRNMSIGRGEVGLISNGRLLDKTIWIVNQETENQTSHRKLIDMTGAVCGAKYVKTNWSLAEEGSIAICKNHEPALTLLYEYEGTFEKHFFSKIDRVCSCLEVNSSSLGPTPLMMASSFFSFSSLL